MGKIDNKMKQSLRQKRINRFNKNTGLGAIIVGSALGIVSPQELKRLLKAREMYLKAFK